MKKIAIVTGLIFAAAALVSAQGMNWGGGSWGMGGPAPTPPEAISVTGNLTIVQGTIAVKNGDATYLTPGLNRYMGFIDSLKDGAQVQIEGFAADNWQDSTVKILWTNKLTVGGKDYDIGQPRMAMRGAQGMRGWGAPGNDGWQDHCRYGNSRMNHCGGRW